jgi:hypothetical protein
MIRSSFALLAAAALTACGDLGFVSSVTGRRAFNPPTVYREWWAAIESCSGRQAPLDRIRWYLADAVSGDGLVARARWSAPHDIIIVAGYENDSTLVRHEMLHDLLDGDRQHRRLEWDRCALRFEASR